MVPAMALRTTSDQDQHWVSTVGKNKNKTAKYFVQSNPIVTGIVGTRKSVHFNGVEWVKFREIFYWGQLGTCMLNGMVYSNSLL